MTWENPTPRDDFDRHLLGKMQPLPPEVRPEHVELAAHLVHLDYAARTADAYGARLTAWLIRRLRREVERRGIAMIRIAREVTEEVLGDAQGGSDSDPPGSPH